MAACPWPGVREGRRPSGSWWERQTVPLEQSPKVCLRGTEPEDEAVSGQVQPGEARAGTPAWPPGDAMVLGHSAGSQPCAPQGGRRPSCRLPCPAPTSSCLLFPTQMLKGAALPPWSVGRAQERWGSRFRTPSPAGGPADRSGQEPPAAPRPCPRPGTQGPPGARPRVCISAGPSVYPHTRRGTHRRTIKQGDASRPAGHLAAVPHPPCLPPPPPALHRPPEPEMNQLTAGCWSTAGRGG